MTNDAEAVRRAARLDGKFVPTTNTNLPADEAALTYRSLWRVERTFRKEKSTLEVGPIFHYGDDTGIGHIVASFLRCISKWICSAPAPAGVGGGAVSNSTAVAASR